MINLSASSEYMMMLHFMTWTLLLCSGLMWVEREGNPRERKILASTLLITFLIMMVRVLKAYKEGIPDGYPVLAIRDLYDGYWALLLVFLYPIEVVSPGLLKKWKNILLLFSSMIAITLILGFVPFEFRELHSWSDVVAYIDEANVWFRIVMLFVIIIPYMLLLLFVPYNWRKSNVDVKWVYRYTIGFQGISVFYVLFMLTGSVTVSFLHLLYYTLFFLYIIYQELHLRLFPAIVKSVPAKEMPLRVVEPEKKPNASDLWKRLEEYMRVEEPWRAPDITIEEIAKAIKSNRTTLSSEIRLQGYASFHDLIAHYRIDAFYVAAAHQNIESISGFFFSVGFRSRTTAFKRFKEQTGMTPAEYLKTVKNGSV